MPSRNNRAELPKYRLYILYGLFGIGSLLLIGKLAHIQIVQHQVLASKASDQYGMTRTLYATRGTIKSSDGFDLAATQPAYQIYAEPQHIGDPYKTARTLTDILNQADIQPQSDSTTTASTNQFNYQTILQQLQQANRLWVAIADKVEQDKVDQIKQANLSGIGFTAQQKRYYPEGNLAAQVLGFVGLDDLGQDIGRYGIEQYFDRELRGQNGSVTYERDPFGNPISVGDFTSQPAQDGKDITLTINRGLQYLLENKLKEGVESRGAESGSMILMEPSTGRILAMANYPSYDPAQFNQVSDYKVFQNATISDVYEPGSVIKTLTVATGIDDKVMTPLSTYLSAPFKVGDHTITTANNKYHGPDTTATRMLEMSDNTGAAQFAMKIGKERFIESMTKVGFGKPTGITLHGEVSGYIPPVKDWLPITLATASFGQGISTTPLQLIQMMSAVANGGVQMKPTIIQSVESQGKSTQVSPQKIGQIFSQQTASQVRQMLEGVVKNGEFRRLALQGYGIAGKTSTSQIPIEGGYDANHTITTFVGFAPASNPKFIMLVKLDKPRINNSAETVVPVWMNMAKDLFTYYGISHQDD